MTLRPVQEKPLAGAAAAQIRKAILDGRYPRGMRLVERELARQLGTSHIPVREALAQLTQEGLVERLPRRGARVAGLTTIELEELTSLRIALERFAVARVQERLSADVESSLHGIVERMVAAATRGDAVAVFKLDREFHTSLWQFAEHSILIDVLNALRSRLDALLREATVRRPKAELKRHAAAHEKLLRAILSRDSERASNEVAAHIEDAAARLRPILTKGTETTSGR